MAARSSIDVSGWLHEQLANVNPVPSRSTVYRVLVRRGLVPARKRKRRRQDY